MNSRFLPRRDASLRTRLPIRIPANLYERPYPEAEVQHEQCHERDADKQVEAVDEGRIDESEMHPQLNESIGADREQENVAGQAKIFLGRIKFCNPRSSGALELESKE